MLKRILFLVSATIFSSSTFAAPGDTATGRETSYNVDVRSVKLCTDSLCAGGYVLGSGSKTFDIASAAAGAEVGSYANIDAVPVGTYSHIQIVLSRTFTVSGTCTVSGTPTTVSGASSSIPNDGGTTDPFVGKTAADGMYWFDAGKTEFAVIESLTAPIVITAATTTQPQATVKFNTSQALSCVDAGPGGILVFPAEPSVNVSVL
jgi:hypothetical protein